MSNLTKTRFTIMRSTIIVALLLLSHLLMHSANAQSQPQLDQFTVTPSDSVIAGEPITIRWSISGLAPTDQPSLFTSWDNPVTESYPIPASGEMDLIAPLAVPGAGHTGQFIIDIFSTPFQSTESLLAEVDMTRHCRYLWFMFAPYDSVFPYDDPNISTPRVPNGCPTRPVVSRAAQQQFENGFMIWIEETDSIWVITPSSRATPGNSRVDTMSFVDQYQNGVHPVSDPTIVPPSGLFQPEYGIGKVWRENPQVRALLGWATAPSVDFETVQQTVTEYRATATPEWRLADGSVLWLNTYEGYYFIEQGLNGFANPNNGFRPGLSDTPDRYNGNTTPQPPINDGTPCPASGAWPTGCNPNLPPETNTPTPPTNGAVPCPASGVWPAGCVPNGGGGTTPPPPPSNGSGCVIPASGPWPACATNGDPAPPDTPADCIIPPSGPWPPCARDGY